MAFDKAQETAANVKGIQQWITNEFMHSGEELWHYQSDRLPASLDPMSFQMLRRILDIMARALQASETMVCASSRICSECAEEPSARSNNVMARVTYQFIVSQN